MKAQFIKCYCLEVFKMEKLSISEYFLISWFISWCESFERVQLKFSQIQKIFPCELNRSEFDRTVRLLVEKGFLIKDSDCHNVTYTVNLDLIQNYQSEHVQTNQKTVPDADAELSDFDSVMADYHNAENSNVIDFVEYAQTESETNIEKCPSAAGPSADYPMQTELIPFSAVSPFPVDDVSFKKKSKKKSVFVIPSIEEVADHMYNFLKKKGIQNLNPKAVEREAEKFWYHYNSKKWKTGKDTMSCWRSSASGWLLRSWVDFEQTSQPQNNLSLEEFQKIVNPHGFEFMTMDDILHPREYYKKRLAMAERDKNKK